MELSRQTVAAFARRNVSVGGTEGGTEGGGKVRRVGVGGAVTVGMAADDGSERHGGKAREKGQSANVREVREK